MNIDGVCAGTHACSINAADDVPEPSGRVAQGVASAAAVSALALLAPDSAAASESASASVLALLASACFPVRMQQHSNIPGVAKQVSALWWGRERCCAQEFFVTAACPACRSACRRWGRTVPCCLW